ncbi:MAG: deoxyhypusine synthase family protein [Candidatus Aenigmatarchaeota archaeon]
MTNVKDIEPKKQTVDELIRQMKSTAFNARKLSDSVDVLEKMIRDKKCVKFLGLSGALVPAGMRKCIVEMIRNGWVDVIVSTGANITHDLSISLGKEHYLHCNPDTVDDVKMAEEKMSRIYDVLSPDRTFVAFEKNIQKILEKICEGDFSTYELMEEIGKRIDDKDSIAKAAAESGVKIIIPAFFDSILGLQVWMYSQDKKLSINPRKDLDLMIKLNYDIKDKGGSSGVFILGGGVPKNYILQSALIPEKPHKYAVQITTDKPQFGGLSGATLREAISWGKLTKDSDICCVNCDATIALPLIVSSLKERLS